MMVGDNTGGAPFLELVFSEFESAPREGGLKKNVILSIWVSPCA